MEWIHQVLLKVQSGHDSVLIWTDGQRNGQTDGQGETIYPLSTSLKAGVGWGVGVGGGGWGYIKL